MVPSGLRTGSFRPSLHTQTFLPKGPLYFFSVTANCSWRSALCSAESSRSGDGVVAVANAVNTRRQQTSNGVRRRLPPGIAGSAVRSGRKGLIIMFQGVQANVYSNFGSPLVPVGAFRDGEVKPIGCSSALSIPFSPSGQSVWAGRGWQRHILPALTRRVGSRARHRRLGDRTALASDSACCLDGTNLLALGYQPTAHSRSSLSLRPDSELAYTPGRTLVRGTRRRNPPLLRSWLRIRAGER